MQMNQEVNAHTRGSYQRQWPPGGHTPLLCADSCKPSCALCCRGCRRGQKAVTCVPCTSLSEEQACTPAWRLPRVRGLEASDYVCEWIQHSVEGRCCAKRVLPLLPGQRAAATAELRPLSQGHEDPAATEAGGASHASRWSTLSTESSSAPLSDQPPVSPPHVSL